MKPLAERFEPAQALAGNGFPPQRREAIACLLTVSDGWREAAMTLGGTFAGVRATGLTGDKEE